MSTVFWTIARNRALIGSTCTRVHLAGLDDPDPFDARNAPGACTWLTHRGCFDRFARTRRHSRSASGLALEELRHYLGDLPMLPLHAKRLIGSIENGSVVPISAGKIHVLPRFQPACATGQHHQ